jgi:hypothetical protein
MLTILAGIGVIIILWLLISGSHFWLTYDSWESSWGNSMGFGAKVIGLAAIVGVGIFLVILAFMLITAGFMAVFSG